ncbi:type I secretion system permease/ATPase [Bradyrhizobium sp. CCGUVB23]|uniref:type I secretion system permease/ATPase n=1 Tax=Bradyrhizobium sp. CCGUVB23 TaxID=2949630 RepID=UPI0020B29CF2|nr:ATP-binding cassette domain-containing protein [Bradyrhizobium sp. CCGUVB23]MCP3461653.1 ATP-binding cassette domain-containing protein [Bradyrhizobium sp. CCGUVB23]
MLMPPLRTPLLPSARTSLEAALWACAGPLGLVFAYSCSYNLLLFAPSIYLLQIYDRVLSSRSGDTLLMLTFIVALTVVVGGVLDALRRVLLGRLGAWVEDRLRPSVLSACLESAFRGDWAQSPDAYRDLTALRQFVESSACPLLFDALWTPFFLGVLFLVHPLLGVVGACSVILLFGLTLAGDLLTDDATVKSGAALSKSYGRLAAAIGNIHLIRAMGMVDGTARLIYTDAQEARREHDVALSRHALIMLATKPVRALSQVVIMGAAAWLVLDYGKSPAIIFVATLMSGRAIAPVEGAIASWKSLATAMKAYRRLNAVLAAIPATGVNAEFPSQQPLSGLVVDNVSLRLSGSNNFPLKGISFSLAPGECLGIIGPSGSGKSLLGQVIAGLTIPTHGRVLLDNADVSLLREGRGGRHLGYLPQDINLFGETINEIIARLDDADPREIVETAKLVGIHDAIMRLPQAYHTVVPGGGVAFSRGYRQRLGLARAFFRNPRLVVLDEPNASLDYAGERMLLDAIEQLKIANVTVIVVTHRMGILGATDKIAIMEGGAVIAFGESEEMFERHLSRPQVVSQVAPAESAPATAKVPGQPVRP